MLTDYNIESGNSYGNKLYNIILSNFLSVYGNLDGFLLFVRSKKSFYKSKNIYGVATNIYITPVLNVDSV